MKPIYFSQGFAAHDMGSKKEIATRQPIFVSVYGMCKFTSTYALYSFCADNQQIG